MNPLSQLAHTPENIQLVRESLKSFFNRLTTDQLIDLFIEVSTESVPNNAAELTTQ